MTSKSSTAIHRLLALLILVSWAAGCGEADVAGLDTESETPASSEVADDPNGMLFTIFQDATGVTMTNAAVAGTEITSLASRAYVDLGNYTEIRAQFSSSLTSALVGCRIEFSLDDGASWSVLVPNFAAVITANATSLSSWGEIPDWARASVLLRGLIYGNAVLDPVVRYVRLEVR